MSFKAKNLTYESNEPAFLRRLRGEVAGNDADRHERPIARPKRLQKDDDEDDGPTYVVEESGDTLSKADYEAMLKGDEPSHDGSAARPYGEDDHVKADSKAEPKQKVTEAGQAQKKRKVAKAIGGTGEDDGAAEPEEQDKGKKGVKKPKKKAKAVKLSFEDE